MICIRWDLSNFGKSMWRGRILLKASKLKIKLKKCKLFCFTGSDVWRINLHIGVQTPYSTFRRSRYASAYSQSAYGRLWALAPSRRSRLPTLLFSGKVKKIKLPCARESYNCEINLKLKKLAASAFAAQLLGDSLTMLHRSIVPALPSLPTYFRRRSRAPAYPPVLRTAGRSLRSIPPALLFSGLKTKAPGLPGSLPIVKLI